MIVMVGVVVVAAVTSHIHRPAAQLLLRTHQPTFHVGDGLRNHAAIATTTAAAVAAAASCVLALPSELAFNTASKFTISNSTIGWRTAAAVNAVEAAHGDVAADPNALAVESFQHAVREGRQSERRCFRQHERRRPVHYDAEGAAIVVVIGHADHAPRQVALHQARVGVQQVSGSQRNLRPLD